MSADNDYEAELQRLREVERKRYVEQGGDAALQLALDIIGELIAAREDAYEEGYARGLAASNNEGASHD